MCIVYFNKRFQTPSSYFKLLQPFSRDIIVNNETTSHDINGNDVKKLVMNFGIKT